MYRAVAAFIVGGFAFGGVGAGLGQQAGVVGPGLTVGAKTATTSAHLTAAVAPIRKAATSRGKAASQAVKIATKIVKYDGFEVSVPASWPVYWLNQDPGQCVRYDVNAVYVGTPSADQNCPAGLMGRADTISIGGPWSPAPTAPTRASSSTRWPPSASQRRSALRMRSRSRPRSRS